MAKNDNVIKLYDTVTIAPGAVDTFLKNVQDNVFGMPGQGKPLLVDIIATHAGRPTRNHGLYLPQKMRDGANTFITPYPKPVLTHHNTHADPIGRVVAAKYVDTSATFPRNSSQDMAIKALCNANTSFIQSLQLLDGLTDSALLEDPAYPGLGHILITAEITDEEAIKKFLDKRYVTVSIGAATDKAVCSICKKDWVEDGFCFVRGTQVLMSDGTTKPIENVCVGDRVISAEGNIQTVERTFKRHYTGELVRLHSRGIFFDTVCTPNHPILVKTIQKVRHRINKTDQRDIEQQDKGSKYLPAGSLVGETIWPIGQCTFTPKISTDTNPDITPTYGYLLGLFLAEGWQNPGCDELQFTLNASEINLVQKLENIFQQEARIYPQHNGSTISVRFTNRTIYQYIQKYISGLATTKKLLPEAISMSRETFKACLSGLIDGDGSYIQDKNTVKLDTSSSDLASQIYMLAVTHGFPCVLNQKDNNGGPDNRNITGKIFTIIFHNEEIRELSEWCGKAKYIYSHKNFDQLIKTESGLAHPYQAVKLATIGTEVYNLQVSQDNSYVANFIGVHNCDHQPGKCYDDKVCRIVAGNLVYDEVSPVNVPADTLAQVVALHNSTTIQNSVVVADSKPVIVMPIFRVGDSIGGSQMAAVQDPVQIVVPPVVSAQPVETPPVVDSVPAVEPVVESAPVEKPADQVVVQPVVEPVVEPVVPVLDESDQHYEDMIEFGWQLSLFDTGFEDAKLTPEKRKALSKSTFCKPADRKYPVPDCNHARVAMAYAKKNNESTAVLACIRRKATALGCPFSGKDSFDEKEIDLILSELVQDKTTQEPTVVPVDSAQVAKPIETPVEAPACPSCEDSLKAVKQELADITAEFQELQKVHVDQVAQFKNSLADAIVRLDMVGGQQITDIGSATASIVCMTMDDLLKKVDSLKSTLKMDAIVSKMNDGMARVPQGTVEDPTISAQIVTDPRSCTDVRETKESAYKKTYQSIKEKHGLVDATKFLSNLREARLVSLEFDPEKT